MLLAPVATDVSERSKMLQAHDVSILLLHPGVISSSTDTCMEQLEINLLFASLSLRVYTLKVFPRFFRSLEIEFLKMV
jgi:hypothetical protein